VNAGGSRDECVFDAGRRRQGLVVDPHEVERVREVIPILGDHDGHRFAGMANRTAGDDRVSVVEQQGGGKQRGYRPIPEFGEILGGENAHDSRCLTRSASIDLEDSRVSVRATDDAQVKASGIAHILHEAATPGDESGVFLAGDCLSEHWGSRRHLALLRIC
jgi:hypothetical protein